jgi:hypothetical protein
LDDALFTRNDGLRIRVISCGCIVIGGIVVDGIVVDGIVIGGIIVGRIYSIQQEEKQERKEIQTRHDHGM